MKNNGVRRLHKTKYDYHVAESAGKAEHSIRNMVGWPDNASLLLGNACNILPVSYSKRDKKWTDRRKTILYV